MRKYLIVIVIVLAMLTAFTGTAAAAPLATGGATLVSVVYVPGKGPVYTFEVHGEYSKAELEGILQVRGGASFGLHCTQVDSSTVKCTSSKKVAGQNVTLSWGGGTFAASVPEAPEVFCYEVWDWDYTVGTASTSWVNYGTYCQNDPASYGDLIDWYNPVWEDSFTYEFMPESPSCFIFELPTHSGDAFYFPIC